MNQLLLSLLLLPAVFVTAAEAGVVLTPLQGSAKRGPNLLADPGFEELKDGRPVGWVNELAGDWTVDSEVRHGGQNSVRFAKASGETLYWISQSIPLDRARPAPMVVGGWSKGEGVEGTRGSEYSVWVDLQYADGSFLYGQRATFEVGTHDWQYSELPFVVSKPVRTVTVNLLFRNGLRGKVWFDDISLQELEVGPGLVFDRAQAALSDSAQRELGAVAKLLETGDGLALGLDAEGRPASLKANGEDLLGTAPGGVWVRDVGAEGAWVCPEGEVVSDGKGASCTAKDQAAGLAVETRWEPTASGIDVHATVSDTTGRDRAVTAYFVLPLADKPWVWHNDILSSTPTRPGEEYMNAAGWPIAGISSAYPFCSLTSDTVGLSLTVPMDCPRIYRLTYNSDLHALYVACDLGLVKDTVNFPSRADFRFSLSWHEPRWGMRAAVRKYYDRHPEFFTRRLKTGGVWMPFGDISQVKDWQDFGFAYDENSATPLQFDNDNGIAAFRYIEPMTYWLPMAKEAPRTYEGALGVLRQNLAGDKAEEKRWAQVTLRAGVFTHDQQYDLSLQNQAWCDGAVFTLNPDPNLPEDADCPVNKGHLGYSLDWAGKGLMQATGPRLDGIYLDSLPNWGEVLNWRRDHWRSVTVPLTFDPVRKEPVLLQMFSTWQYADWIARDVHARGGVMHGNGGALWAFFPALLDVTGQETGGILDQGTMAMARTLLRDKPYSPLLNTQFSKLPADYHDSYFHRSLLWDIFPSYFDGDYMQDGKWVIGRFFDKPELYEHVRPLYRKFIPILRRLFAAGWEPVTEARAEPAGVRVERYGPQPGGETLLAVYNPGKEAVVARVTVSAGALKLTATQATGLVSGAGLEATREGDLLTITVPLAADRSEVVRLGP